MQNGFVADLVPLIEKVVISSTPQTFNLQNFRTVIVRKDWSLFAYQYAKLTGTITLSCNAKADILTDYTVNTYDDSKNRTFRFSGKNVLNALDVPIILSHISPEIDKYMAMADVYLKIRYDEYSYNKFSLPNSLKNASVMERDASGKASRIRALCRFRSLPNEDKWMDLLLNEGKVFGLIYWDQINYIYTPDKDLNNRPYSEQELKSMQTLQSKYLFKMVMDFAGQKQVSSRTCLTPTNRTYTTPKYEKVARFSTGGNGKPEFDGYDNKYVGEITVNKKEWTNKCSSDILIIGISKHNEGHAIFYSVEYETVKIGGSVPYKKFEMKQDYLLLNDGKIHFYVK